jgi:6-phospho-beta-glucosidase
VKLTIIGGGSIFTPLLLDGLHKFAGQLSFDDVALLDIDLAAAERVAAFTRRSLARHDVSAPRILPTSDHQRAIEGSDFVVITIRVGGLPARVQDEKIPLRYGILGDETTGPGGFSNALRTIPVMIDYAREIERCAPHAWVIPFTNPEGLLTEALTRHTGVRAIGLCTAPYGLRMGAALLLGVEPRRVQADLIGVTHTGWVRSITVDGAEVLPRLVDQLLSQASDGSLYPPQVMRALDAYPAHWFYSLLRSEAPHFYYHARRIYERQVAQSQTRAELLIQRQKEIQPRLESADFTVGELATLRGHQIIDEPILALMSALHNDRNEVHVVDVPAGAAVPGFESEAVIELPARINASGAHPLPVERLPAEVRGLMQMIKAYEELTVEAAVRGSYALALRALVAHPLVMSYETAKPLLDDILEANRPYLPARWGTGGGAATG